MKARYFLAVTALGLCACGPSEREVGSWMLLALPLIVALGGLLQLGYRALWRKVVDQTEVGRMILPPTLWLLGASAVLFIIPFLIGEVDDELLLALWAGGSTYAAYLLLSMRLTIGSERRYGWSALVPWLLIAPAAVGFALFGSTTEGEFAQMYYMLPGYAGLVPGGIALLMLLEVGVRRHVRRSREKEIEPVFPETRALADFDEVTPENPRQFVARTPR